MRCGCPGAAAARWPEWLYVNVRGKQGRKKKKFQGCTLNKTRRTSLYSTPREAAVALAMLKQRPEEQADPIRHIDFAFPAPPLHVWLPCVRTVGCQAVDCRCGLSWSHA